MRFMNELRKNGKFTTIQFVKRIQNDVNDDVVRDAESSKCHLNIIAFM